MGEMGRLGRVRRARGDSMPSVAERASMLAWHPFSLASQSRDKIEFLIDIHPGPGPGQKTWTRRLFEHVQALKVKELQGRQAYMGPGTRNEYSAPFEKARWVDVIGPFASSFARCFERDAQRRDVGCDKSSYDIVVLYGGGLGLPSALSALSEFC